MSACPKLSRPPTDVASREWLRSLRADGATRNEAVERLHALLLRAARFEAARRRRHMPHVRDELEEIAHEAAGDALISVLAHLDDFRGESRFTTWAYKFASARDRSQAAQACLAGAGAAARAGGLEPVRERHFRTGRCGSSRANCCPRCRRRRRLLTPRQRRVLIALTLNGVPIDVLAERLDTTRGALYKTLHDARRKLRAHLAEREPYLATRC